MAISRVKYNYTFDMTYVGPDNQSFEIPIEKIIDVVISEDYSNNNMPMMFLTLSLDKKQIALMAQTMNNAKIIMSEYKFIIGNDMIVKDLCFRQEFTYFMDKNLNYVNDFDYDESGENENQLFRKFKIGLLVLDHVNGTRTQLDGISSGTTMANLIYSFLGDRPVLIEPFLDNSVWSNIIIPPSTSISKLIDKLDKVRSFYNTPYRFFQGFDCTYLVSSSGKAVPKKNEKMSKVIININPNRESDNQADGFFIDDQQACYILEIPTSAKSISNNIAAERSYNVIDAVDDSGNVISKNVSQSGVINTKRELVRLPNGNTARADALKAKSANTKYIQIMKNNVDNTVFTINKEYWFTFNDGSDEPNGRYLLLRKDDMYYRFEENYMCTTRLTFVKIEE